jgi:hypothetical protein
VPAVRFVGNVNPNGSIPPQESAGLCFVCYDTIYIAQKLGCEHRFCLGCIHEWLLECRMSRRAPVCPICRAPFSASQIIPGDAVLRGHELLVWSVEPILYRLKIRSCRTIKAVHIFKEWSDRHRTWFWQTFKEVSQIFTDHLIFLSLTKTTPAHVACANSSQLAQAMKNFDLGEPSENRNENIRKLLLYILRELTSIQFGSHKNLHRDHK